MTQSLKRRALHRTLTRAAAIAALAFPFVVGFGPPDSSGTYVSLHGGAGRVSYSYSSCGYTTHVRSSLYHAGGSVEHRVRPQGWRDPNSLAPRLVTIGASGSGIVGRSYTYDTRDSAYTGERLNEDRERATLEAAGLRLGLDWRYVGLSGGAILGFVDGRQAAVLPSMGVRFGNTVYFTASALGQPFSPLALGETGFGYKTAGFGMWYGLRAPYGGSLLPTAKFARLFRAGELGVTLMAGPGDDRTDYGGEAFLRYRLPFQ